MTSGLIVIFWKNIRCALFDIVLMVYFSFHFWKQAKASNQNIEKQESKRNIENLEYNLKAKEELLEDTRDAIKWVDGKYVYN